MLAAWLMMGGAAEDEAPAPGVPVAPTDLSVALALFVSNTPRKDYYQIDPAPTWTDASSDEDGFRFERSINGGAWTQRGVDLDPGTEALPGAHQALTDEIGPEMNARYRVRAFNEVGNSASSNVIEITTGPAYPTGLTLTNLGGIFGNRYRLQWVDNSATTPDFNVYMNVDGGGWSLLDTVAGGTILYDTAEFPPTTSRQFRVHAENANGESGPSNTVSV